MVTKSPSKYRVTVFHPPWYMPWGDLQVSLEILNGRTKRYVPCQATDVGVRDVKRIKHGSD